MIKKLGLVTVCTLIISIIPSEQVDALSCLPYAPHVATVEGVIHEDGQYILDLEKEIFISDVRSEFEEIRNIIDEYDDDIESFREDYENTDIESYLNGASFPKTSIDFVPEKGDVFASFSAGAVCGGGGNMIVRDDKIFVAIQTNSTKAGTKNPQYSFMYGNTNYVLNVDTNDSYTLEVDGDKKEYKKEELVAFENADIIVSDLGVPNPDIDGNFEYIWGLDSFLYFSVVFDTNATYEKQNDDSKDENEKESEKESESETNEQDAEENDRYARQYIALLEQLIELLQKLINKQ
jgi:hypothetical protein